MVGISIKASFGILHAPHAMGNAPWNFGLDGQIVDSVRDPCGCFKCTFWFFRNNGGRATVSGPSYAEVYQKSFNA